MSRKSGSTKKALGKKRLEETEAVFTAIAHGTRRQILMVLHFRRGKLTAGEIADRFSCKWPTVTRHLKVLESAGLVEVNPQGRERIYRLNEQRLVSIIDDWTQWFREQD